MMYPEGSLEISLFDQELVLLPEKALYWKEFKTLIISDLHLGKSGHFRKHGIAVPESVNASNIQRLDVLTRRLTPEKIIFLGDLFHSQYNAEFESFKHWRRSHAGIDMVLTIGNHDIISRHEFQKTGLECVNTLRMGPFLFMHDESDDQLNTKSITVSGHIHPAIKLKTKGRQSIYSPCYYIGGTNILLPAFGTFTGTFLVEPKQNDRVFAVVEDKVINVSTLV